MKIRRYRVCVGFWVMVVAGAVFGAGSVPCWGAPLALPPLFSDHMVVQAGMPAPIWGAAGPGVSVTVDFAGQTHSTTSDDKGEWKVVLKALKASAEPRVLRVTAADQVLEIKDVLVGEVWLCSGQSNMDRNLEPRSQQPTIPDWEKEAAAATYPMIRQFRVGAGSVMPAKNGRRDAAGAWTVCSPETAPKFSAVGYFFARELFKARNVPVGIVVSAVGATPAELWIPKEALAEIPDATMKGDVANKFGRHFYGGIQPLVPFALRGVVWYQGESNNEAAGQYGTVLSTLIKSWRNAWGREFPFIFVQIPPHAYVPAELREGQLQTWQTVPDTAMVVTTDLGYATNPRDWHPPYKAPIGARLALAARAVAYGEKIEYSGPIYKDMQVSGSAAVLSFTHVGGGLAAKDGELKGFEVAGADGKFVKATAVIQGDKVAVSSPDVATPAAVRYGWGTFFEANLFNKAGLPASPFRTGP